MRTPQYGEVWVCPDGTLLPGGLVVLVISGDEYNEIRTRRIVVEVVSDTLTAASAFAVPIGPAGHAIIAEPFTAPLEWFDLTGEPVAELDERTAAEVVERLRHLLGS